MIDDIFISFFYNFENPIIFGHSSTSNYR